MREKIQEKQVMALLKALIGGLVGGGLGGYAASILQPMLQTATPWSILIAGLLAGLGARLACGKDRSFLTGVLAAVAAIAAPLGITYVNSMATIKSATENQPAAISPERIAEMMAEDDEEEDEAAADDSDSDSEDDETETATVDDADDGDSRAINSADDELAQRIAEENARRANPSGNAIPAIAQEGRKQGTSDQTTMDMIINGASALIAFMLGSGSGPAATVPSVETVINKTEE